jgi:hypothetical protein
MGNREAPNDSVRVPTGPYPAPFRRQLLQLQAVIFGIGLVLVVFFIPGQGIPIWYGPVSAVGYFGVMEFACYLQLAIRYVEVGPAGVKFRLPLHSERVAWDRLYSPEKSVREMIWLYRSRLSLLSTVSSFKGRRLYAVTRDQARTILKQGEVRAWPGGPNLTQASRANDSAALHDRAGALPPRV